MVKVPPVPFRKVGVLLVGLIAVLAICTIAIGARDNLKVSDVPVSNFQYSTEGGHQTIGTPSHLYTSLSALAWKFERRLDGTTVKEYWINLDARAFEKASPRHPVQVMHRLTTHEAEGAKVLTPEAYTAIMDCSLVPLIQESDAILPADAPKATGRDWTWVYLGDEGALPCSK